MKDIKRIVVEILRWSYWFPFRKVVQHIPYKAGFFLIFPIALLAYALNAKKRRRSENGYDKMFEMGITFRKRMDLTIKTFYNHFKKGIDVFWYPKLTESNCEEIVHCEGLSNLDAALLEGRGVVLLHGHLGNPHMLMPAIGFKGYMLSQLGSRNPPGNVSGPYSRFINNIEYKLYKLKLSYKEALPVDFIYTDRFLRKVIRRLESNRIIAMAIDGREGNKWVEIDFLNHRALFSTGIMKLILKLNPVVLPTFVVRQNDNTHNIIISKPLELKSTGDMEKDILENMRSFLSLFEKYVYTYPDQYGDSFWLGEQFFLNRADHSLSNFEF